MSFIFERRRETRRREREREKERDCIKYLSGLD